MSGRRIVYGQACTRCKYGCKYIEVCNCCPWCCEECNKSTYESCDICYIDFHYKFQVKKDCHYKGCNSQTITCTNPKCQCTCCKAKCARGEIPTCSLPPPPPPLPSPGAEPEYASQKLSSPPDALKQETDAPPSPPPYTTIAAVIVAIIVAIILLDLCIFRFPVGRNIRDFLVRKIPLCIAFYS
ncbi:hypothetical protein BBBOND_0109230 [Babesia bigemina]|uniref:Uncharacterized protein n=1 Tax=Babesia bigemina TaxID=5866 RepID=A0A061DA53_BABBI|nr:hypothetical protein BBBOND_0109230 [Babesia bigemina]CDR94625.1 hypothetical protein BBBOND_0109230 [Babesia bigemina]|eukprot:XP_012766811.1 hypothetical protein BBBOND_0109230 [Babesia bigemina]